MSGAASCGSSPRPTPPICRAAMRWWCRCARIAACSWLHDMTLQQRTNRRHTMKRVLAALLLLAPAMAHAQTDAELYAAAKAAGVVNFAGSLKRKETEKAITASGQHCPASHVTYT